MAEVVIVGSPEEAGELVAGRIWRRIVSHPRTVLGVATGSTPLPVYRALARLIADYGTDVSAVRAFALDEYLGLPPGSPSSYRSVLEHEVVGLLGLRPDALEVPDGFAPDPVAAADGYEAAIVRAGGVDVQLLGIGRTGHIGFNEPGSSLASLTRVKALAAQTRLDNARFFDRIDDVPFHCITQGIGTILRARELVLLAFGESKAEAVAAAVEGPVTASHPGSALQLHPRVTVVVDDAAASALRHADYYRSAWERRDVADTVLGDTVLGDPVLSEGAAR